MASRERDPGSPRCSRPQPPRAGGAREAGFPSFPPRPTFPIPAIAFSGTSLGQKIPLRSRTLSIAHGQIRTPPAGACWHE